MLPDTGQIKKAAMAVFKENTVGSLTVSFSALVTFFLGFFIAYLFSAFSSGIGVLLFLLFYFYLFVSPVILGTIRYFSILIEGKSVKPVETFHYFSSFKVYKKSIRFISSLFFRILGSIILVMLIPSILTLFSTEGFYRSINAAMPIWTPMLKTASVFLEILGAGLVILINIKYYLSIYFFVCNDNVSVKQALYFSKIVSRKTKSDFWLLLFSMILYIVLSITVLPLFFILPYFMLSYVVHGKCAAVQYNESIDFAMRQYTVVAR